MHRPIRKAGVALARMDDAYSNKIVDLLMGPKENPRRFTENPVLGTGAGIGAIFGGGTSVRQGMKGDNATKGAAISSAAVRYGAPGLALGLAGQAAIDLGSNQQSSGTLGL